MKHAKKIWIYQLEDDMNIDCVVDEVEISLRCLQNMETYKLGTQTFFGSVSSITIDYKYDIGKSIFEDLEIAHEYFKNLKYVNLRDI